MDTRAPMSAIPLPGVIGGLLYGPFWRSFWHDRGSILFLLVPWVRSASCVEPRIHSADDLTVKYDGALIANITILSAIIQIAVIAVAIHFKRNGRLRIISAFFCRPAT